MEELWKMQIIIQMQGIIIFYSGIRVKLTDPVGSLYISLSLSLSLSLFSFFTFNLKDGCQVYFRVSPRVFHVSLNTKFAIAMLINKLV